MSQEKSLVLAALLHDIGKFWQRTSHPLEQKDRTHTLLSHQFILDHFGQTWDQSASLASAHHRPDDYLSKLIQLADHLSSLEREHQEEGNPAVKQLLSVFSQVGTGSSPCYFPLKPLDIHRDTIFPKQETDKEPEQSYTELWDNFVRETATVTGLYGVDFPALINTFYHLLCKFTWCIPSSYHSDIPDVSLFDHLRTTCAIALSLFCSGISESEVDLLLAGNSDTVKEKPCLSLIGGDICGVQRFLYTQTSKGVAKGLRGRSFYLELLTEVAAWWLLRQLGLYTVNLLYAGGGRFYVLAHHVDGQTLASLRRDFSQALLKHHHGALHLALATQELCPQDFSHFSEALAGVQKKLGWAKQRPFDDLAPGEFYEEILKPKSASERADICAVCGAEDARHKLGEGEERECELCHSLKHLGEQLADANYLLIAPRQEGQQDVQVQGWQKLFFFGLGFAVRLLDEPHQVDLNRLGPGATLLRLNSTDFLNTELLNTLKSVKNPPALGFRFLAQASPRKKEEPAEIADFETVAQASEGVPFLGVLRMDVDDLGWLFQHGLGEVTSISRVCSTSFLLRLFFEGWLNSLCARWNPHDGKDKVYAIYAGGDDLLVTSSWSEIAELAWNIHRDFSEFTCCNPLVHISGGTTVDEPHFPLYQLIEAATESLESGAKRMPGKNAFTFLGQTLNWSQFQKVSEWRDMLKDIISIDGRIEQGKAPRTLLHLLMELHQSYLEGQTMDADRRLFHGPTIHYGPWMWHAAYHLSRMIELVEGPAQAHLAEIREALMQAERLSVELPQLALAARWVELLTRTEGL